MYYPWTIRTLSRSHLKMNSGYFCSYPGDWKERGTLTDTLLDRQDISRKKGAQQVLCNSSLSDPR